MQTEIIELTITNIAEKLDPLQQHMRFRNQQGSLQAVTRKNTRYQEDQLQAFFEAFFSNRKDGTQLTLQEAAAAIERHQLPEDQQKRADALDMQALLKEIRGSWWGAEMNADPVAWMEEIRCTHARIRQHADSHHAGLWKRQANVAGQLRFPLAEKVIPGLRWAHHHAQQATPGLARATILYVGIVLVHPFNDGNGRIARLVMNQELAHNEYHVPRFRTIVLWQLLRE